MTSDVTLCFWLIYSENVSSFCFFVGSSYFLKVFDEYSDHYFLKKLWGKKSFLISSTFIKSDKYINKNTKVISFFSF